MYIVVQSASALSLRASELLPTRRYAFANGPITILFPIFADSDFPSVKRLWSVGGGGGGGGYIKATFFGQSSLR